MQFGLDRLLAEPALRRPLAGRRVALLAHPASVSSDMTHAIDALAALGDVRLVAAFGPQHEAFVVVEVRPAGRVAQRPVRQRAVIRLEHRRQSETKRVVTVARRESVERHERVELESATFPAHDDRGRHPIVVEGSSVSIRTERVHRPLA